MRVLFVCVGNICRSPMAEAMFRHEAAFHASLSDVDVASAGIIAQDGHVATSPAIEVSAREHDLDLTPHRARRLLTTDTSDLILTLDRWVQEAATRMGLTGRVELLGDYAGSPGEEVDDPYQASLETYRQTASQVQRLVQAAVRRLARERSGFDLPAYFARLGYAGPAACDLATLRAIHRAHTATIPFENLDIQMGRPILLDLPHLQRKLVGARRGGYCFEQNTLFLHALRAIGFDVIACEARVRPPGHDVLARTHMVLVVTLEGERWLCDAGFGADGPLEPVAFRLDEQRQGLWAYRLRPERARHVLQQLQDGDWVDLYAFVPEARYPVDFEVGNWYTSAFPGSRFVITLTAQRATPEARHVLRDLRLVSSDAHGAHVSEIDRPALVPLLGELFGIDVPADARFRALDPPEAVA